LRRRCRKAVRNHAVGFAAAGPCIDQLCEAKFIPDQLTAEKSAEDGTKDGHARTGCAEAYLFWQLCLHVCAWLSQELRQGVLKVVGQTRLQDAF
jgi:hypothetical protein